MVNVHAYYQLQHSAVRLLYAVCVIIDLLMSRSSQIKTCGNLPQMFNYITGTALLCALALCIDYIELGVAYSNNVEYPFASTSTFELVFI